MASLDRALSFGLVDGRPVFMDAREDLYFLLEPEEEEEFARLLGSSAPHERSAALGAALGMHPGCRLPPPVSIEPPTESLLDRPCRRLALADLLLAALALMKARRRLRKWRIADLLDRLGGNRAHGAAEDMVEAAARFAAARRYLPWKPHCLTDSLALLDFVTSFGSGAILVFGVKLDPFAAHCWVQSNSLLLNDRLEHVERFHPVRSVTCAPATR